MNAFELFATITLEDEEYKKKLGESGEATSSFGKKLGKGLATAAKAGGAAIAAAGTAVSAVVKQSVSAYAEYEQLVGGVETLFKDSADIVQGYAANAYQTAGLSANDYMNTVTSFSASLLQSLEGDTGKAASLSNQAITDMADNANKMGSSMESIQTAYAGFAKQNYTMLDNLKLGYGGTKSEMERLISDANALREAQGKAGDLTIEKYSDVIEAIHEVQTNMGITGTTALEASTTIQGSLSMAKAAWQNLLVGIADDSADFGALVTKMVDSVSTAASNILPRITQALSGIGQLITGLAPVLQDAVPQLISTVLPSLLSAAGSLISALGSGLLAAAPTLLDTALSVISTLVSGLANGAGDIIGAAASLLFTFAESLVSAAPQLGESAGQLIIALVTGIVENLPQIIGAAVGLVVAFAEAIISAVVTVGQAAAEMVAPLLEKAGQLASDLWSRAVAAVTNFAKGIRDKVSEAVSAAGEVLSNVVSTIAALPGELWNMAITAITDFANGVRNKVSDALSAAAEVASSVVSAVSSLPGSLLSTATSAVTNFVTGIQNKIASVASAAGEIVSSVTGAIAALPGQALTWGADLIQNFIDGISSMIGALVGKVGEVAGKVKSFLGFSEPEDGPLSNFHTYAPDMMDLFIKGIKDNERKLQNQIASTFDFGDMVTGAPLPSVAASGTSGAAYGGVVNIYPQQMDEATVDYLVGRVQRELGWVLA